MMKTFLIIAASATTGFLLGTFVETPLIANGERWNNNASQTESRDDMQNQERMQTNEARNDNSDEVAFTMQVSRLPESQQSMLRTVGVEGSEIVITRGMVACAEGKFGASRVEEIKNGASVSMGEGIGLMACYTGS